MKLIQFENLPVNADYQLVYGHLPYKAQIMLSQIFLVKKEFERSYI